MLHFVVEGALSTELEILSHSLILADVHFPTSSMPTSKHVDHLEGQTERIRLWLCMWYFKPAVEKKTCSQKQCYPHIQVQMFRENMSI